MFIFRKIGVLCFLETPVLRFALLPYYRRYLVEKTLYKAGFTLNDLYDTTCMTHNRFANFHCVYTIIQVVHTESIKVVHTEYSAPKSSSKMIQEQAAAAVIIPLIFEKNNSREKRKRKKSLCKTLS